jgi:serine/threonine protein phosphatase 1
MERKSKPNETYFVVSDIHGFHDELVSALKLKGFDIKNPDHILIVVGDIFDRGRQARKVYEFLISIPKKRRVMIRGNHEDMFLNIINKKFPDSYDFHNKTVNTLCQLVCIDEELLLQYFNYADEDTMLKFQTSAKSTWKNVVNQIVKQDVYLWIASDEWINYLDLDGFLFTHSFIPLRNKGYNPNWRTDTLEKEWEWAHSGCPWILFKQGFFKEEYDKGKTIVFGHWHTSEIHKRVGGDTGPDRTDIFYGDGFIAIDGGIQIKNNKLVHPCNVLVIKDNKVIK